MHCSYMSACMYVYIMYNICMHIYLCDLLSLSLSSPLSSYPFFATIFQGIILVYDITNEKSFDNIKTWIRYVIA